LQPIVVDKADHVTGELEFDVVIRLPITLLKREIEDIKPAEPQGFLANLTG